ncbi:TPA: hypothetical protein ACFLEE_000378 [Neisseria gonorrhoeae]
MKLTLALPSLNLDEDEIRIPLCLPAFNKILQYGSPHRQSCTASAFYARYLWCGRLAQRPAQSLNMPSETVALATPVWQKMGLHQANVLTAEYLDVGTDEAERLCRDLSAFYGDIPWRFVPVLPELWLVSLPRAYRWGAKPVLDLGGLLGADDQPDGEDALEWLRVQTEIQMWLNAHPVNHNRKKRGLPELNGLWLWDNLHGSAQGGTLFADTVWSRFHPNRRALPDSFRAYAETAAHLPDTHHILFMDDLRLTALTGDRERYAAILQQWEERWFAPLYEAVRTGKIKRLDIATDGQHGGTLTFKPTDRRKFWRCTKTFDGIW